jgi:molecular chaperone DnaK
MDINGNNLDVIATDGDPSFGGYDFDGQLVDTVIACLEEQGHRVSEENDKLFGEIGEKVESAKKALSTVEQSTLVFTIDGKTYRVKVTREQFEELTKKLLYQTEEQLGLLMSNNRLTWKDIDHLLMIGGSTRMPMVKSMLQRLSGKTLRHEMNPDEAVALGAAIYASTLRPVRATKTEEDHEQKNHAEVDDAWQEQRIPAVSISDVTSQSLGVITISDGSEHNSILIPHNTKIPAKRSDEFATSVDNQTRLNIQVTEGNDSELEYVSIVGSKEISIPPYPKGSPIRITYAYDIDQTIFVEVYDLVANQQLGTFDIDRTANLTDEQVSKLKDKLCSIPGELDNQ